MDLTAYNRGSIAGLHNSIVTSSCKSNCYWVGYLGQFLCLIYMNHIPLVMRYTQKEDISLLCIFRLWHLQSRLRSIMDKILPSEATSDTGKLAPPYLPNNLGVTVFWVSSVAQDFLHPPEIWAWTWPRSLAHAHSGAGGKRRPASSPDVE